MTENEINRAVQYVVASTSYGKDTVRQIVRTGFAELAELAGSSVSVFERDTLLEYVVRWTMNRTGQPEALVREVLTCAGRWLDEMYETMARERSDLLERSKPPASDA